MNIEPPLHHRKRKQGIPGIATYLAYIYDFVFPRCCYVFYCVAMHFNISLELI